MTENREALSQFQAESAQIEHLAQELNEICRSATLDLAFRIGEVIIARLFNHDARLWQHAEATPSYRALSNRGDLILSASALCRAVSTYVLVERLGGRTRWRHLCASHFQEVLALPPPMQEALLASAEEGRWTVARLRNAAAPVRRRRGSGTVRITRCIEQLSSRLAEHNEELVRAGLVDAGGESVDQLKGAIDSAFRQLVDLSAWLERQTVPACSSVANEPPPRRKAT
jgi:hypothetical protein